MAKRRGAKRVFPKTYARIPHGIDRDRISAYYNATRSTRGAKDDKEPVQGNTFQRVIVEGQVMHIQCTCGAGPFKFKEDFDYHVNTQRRWTRERGRMVVIPDPDRFNNHIGEYVPERVKGHWDSEVGNLFIPNNFLNTPKKETERRLRDYKVEQTDRLQWIEKWHWGVYQKLDWWTIEIGCKREVWKLRKTMHNGKQYESQTFKSRVFLDVAFNANRIVWFDISS